MRLRPERPPDAPVSTLAGEEQNTSPEHEAGSRVGRVGVGDETGLVEMTRLRVDVQQWVGPIGR